MSMCLMHYFQLEAKKEIASPCGPSLVVFRLDTNGLVGRRTRFLHKLMPLFRVPLTSESCTGSVLRLAEEKGPDECSVEEVDEMYAFLIL